MKKMRDKMLRLVFVLFVLSLLTVQCVEFPKYLTKCKVTNNTNLDDCLKDQANIMIQHIIEGDEEFRIPRLNPTLLPRMLLSPTKDFRFDLRNCYAFGMTNFNLSHFKMDQKFQTLEFNFLFNNSQPTWLCIYRATGELQKQVFDDRGFVNITFVNMTGEYSADYDSKEKNEQYYYQAKNDVLILSIDKLTFNLTHIDGSDAEQAKQLNKILNEEYQDFSKEFISSTKIIGTGMITHIINNILGEIPIDELFES